MQFLQTYILLANASLPILLIFIPLSGAFIPLIVAIETLLAKYIILLGWNESLKFTFISNMISTLFGIPFIIILPMMFSVIFNQSLDSYIVDITRQQMSSLAFSEAFESSVVSISIKLSTIFFLLSWLVEFSVGLIYFHDLRNKILYRLILWSFSGNLLTSLPVTLFSLSTALRNLVNSFP